MHPDKITFSRFIFGIAAVISAYKSELRLFSIFYGLALLSDILDGFIARKTKKQTDNGKKLDIIADNFVVICVLISLNFLGRLRYVEIFLVIFLYYVLMQIINLISNNHIIFHRSLAANLAAIIFPILIFSMLFNIPTALIYVYSILMFYSLTEKLFLKLKFRKTVGFYLLVIVLCTVTFAIPMHTEVCFDERCIKVEVMDTQSKRSLGLMHRTELDEDEGMLFVFEKPDYYQFYMKNMKIPIDMIFVDDTLTITRIFHSRLPCTNEPCELYSSDAKTQYVIETKSGFSEKHNVKNGDKIKIV